MTPDLLIKCQNRYKNKNWASEQNRIGKLYERIANLTDEEIELIFTLTDDFIYCPFFDVVYQIKSSYEKIPIKDKQNAREILIAPLKDPLMKIPKLPFGEKYIEKPKSKSADIYFPLFQRVFDTTDPFYYKVRFCDDIKILCKNYKNDSLLILVDDFVGTGLTVSGITSSIGMYLKSKSKQLRYSDIKIICAYAMYQGERYLKSQFGIDCFCSELIYKGIICNKMIAKAEKIKSLSIMQNIERKLFPKMSTKNTLGFGQSEALISIGDKCPNNTFPFYWYGEKKDKPIFPRDK